MQLAQASLLMKELIRLRQNQPKLPIVFCGDLNSERKSLVREYILQGMPRISKGDGEGLFFDMQERVPASFSDVWKTEFNQMFDRKEETRTWKPDCFPWQQLWFGTEELLPRNGSHIVPFQDAFEELHDDPKAFTNPGDDLIIDHMCAF